MAEVFLSLSHWWYCAPATCLDYTDCFTSLVSKSDAWSSVLSVRPSHLLPSPPARRRRVRPVQRIYYDRRAGGRARRRRFRQVSKVSPSPISFSLRTRNSAESKDRETWPQLFTGFSSQIGTKLRDWAVGQAGAGCYSQEITQKTR